MKSVANQSGQFIVEAILIMVMLFAVVLAIANAFKSQSLFAQVVSAPWQHMSGMIQNGVWATREQSMTLHPSNHSRHRVLKGEDPK